METTNPRIEIRVPDQPKRVVRVRKALKAEAKRKGMKLAPHCLAILEAHLAKATA